MSIIQRCLLALLLNALLPGVVWSQAGPGLFETISAEGTAAPAIGMVDVSAPGDYEIVVSDFGVSASPVPPATGIYVLITRTDTNEVAANLSGPGSSVADLAATEYRVTLVVVPDPTVQRSSVGVNIRPVGGGTAVFDRVEAFDNRPVTENPSAHEFDFEATSAARYEFAIVDAAFPDAFDSLETIFLDRDTGAPLATASGPGTVALDLNAGDRVRIAVVATRAAESDRSLLVVNITDSGSSVASYTARIGGWDAVVERSLAVAGAGTVTTTVTDFSLPQPVSGLKTVVLQDGLPVIGPINGPGSSSGSLVAGPASLFVAVAGTATGTVGLSTVGPGNAVLLDEVVSFDADDGVSGRFASIDAVFSVDDSDTLTFLVRDFRFPTAFSTVAGLIARDGTEVVSIDSAGTITVDVEPGDYSLAVIGELPQGSAGLIAVGLTASDGTVLVEEFAAGGSAIRSLPVTIAAGGLLRLDLADLRFPAAFQTLNAALTRGTELIGSAFGGGSFVFDAIAGEYFVHLIARPGAAIGHSTFALAVSEQPRAPTATLTSDRNSVPTGGEIQLSWQSDFADDCVASGGWSGDKGPSGTERITNLRSETEFRLTCSGPGGAAEAKVLVTVTAASGGGGGGQLDAWMLMAIGMILLLRRRSRKSPIAC